MTLQEKIEILDGVKNHPNKEKLVFKIDDAWISYLKLEDSIGEEIYLSDSTLISMKLNSEEVKQKYNVVFEQSTPTSDQEDCNNLIQGFVDKINSNKRLRWYDPISNEMKKVEATKINQ